MSLPNFSLTTSGTAPKYTTSQILENGVNAVIAALYSEFAAGLSGLAPKGNWDASSGAFPSGSAVGDYYIVSVAGTVGVEGFEVGDWLVSLAANASTSTFAANWFRGDYSQINLRQFASVGTMAGSLTLVPDAFYTVASGFNGEPETFQYDAASTATADGALIVKFIADNRTQPAGATLNIPSIGAVYQATDGAGNLDRTNAGGQAFDVLNGGVRAFGTVGDGVTDDTAALQASFDAFDEVYLPDGDYLTSSLTVTRSNVKIHGRGRLIASGTGNLIEITGISGGAQIKNVVVDGLSFLGLNNMNAGPVGCGVLVSYSENVTVKNCRLDSFGPGVADNSSGGGAICFYVNNIDVTVHNNTVENGSGILNGADIMVYSASGYAIITDNRCYSTNSNGIYSDAATKVGRVIIQGNICQNHTRHGIICGYASAAGTKIDTIVTGNICQNCLSTGIYLNDSPDGVVCTDNVIESCSGGGRNGYSLDGGISFVGAGNIICSNNQILNTGYDTDGVIRSIDPLSGVANDVTRIRAIALSNGVSGIVSGNFINGGAGRGIDLINGANGVEIVNNKILNPQYAGIHIGAINNGGRYRIAGNYIDVSTSDVRGIWHRGSAVPDFGNIDDNIVIGALAATNKVGMGVEGTSFRGSLSRNHFVNWDFGIDILSEPSVEALGLGLIMDGNALEGCNVGFRYTSDLTAHSFHTNTVYVNCVTAASDLLGRNTVLPALSVSPRKVFYKSTVPTTGTWAVGDRCIRLVPVVGQPKAWACVAAGSPGSWVSEGNL